MENLQILCEISAFQLTGLFLREIIIENTWTIKLDEKSLIDVKFIKMCKKSIEKIKKDENLECQLQLMVKNRFILLVIGS